MKKSASYSVGGGRLPGKKHKFEFGGGVRTGEETRQRTSGIVGRDGGYTAQVADVAILIPTVNPGNVTPHSEAFQLSCGIYGLSPAKGGETKWESMN